MHRGPANRHRTSETTEKLQNVVKLSQYEMQPKCVSISQQNELVDQTSDLI